MSPLMLKTLRGRSRLIAVAIGAALAFFSPLAAHAADGFDAASAESYARGSASLDARMNAAATAAERMRAGLVLNPVEFVKGAAPVEQIALTRALGGTNAQSATYISWFFRTASRTISGDPSMPIVTFFNPLADAAIVTTWRRIDANWWLTAAFRIDGASLRGAAGATWWEETDRAFTEALADQAGAALRAAGGLVSPQLMTLPEIDFATLEARLIAAQKSLAAWVTDADKMAAYDKARAALAAAKPDRIGLGGGSAPTSEQLQALSGDVRQTLTAVAVYQRADGFSVALSSPLKPELILFVDFNGAAKPSPVNVSAVNLANAALPGGRS